MSAGGLIRSTAVVSAMTLLSRILGFVRDMVLARAFGAGLALDAFFVAFKIPNLLRRLFGEGAFSLAFVPVLSEYREHEGADATRELVDRVSGTLALILVGVSLVGVVAAPLLVTLFAPGFLDEPGKFGLTGAMLRVTFPYILFISLVAFAGSILNTWGRFAIPAFAPVLLNLVLIAAALWAAPLFEQPVMALAWAVFLGGLAQLAFMLPGLARLGLLPRPRWGWRHPGVQKILRLMGPAVVGSSVAQINLLFDTLIASFLVTGSVSWLYFADRMVEFPLGVFGIALSTVILPSLSGRHAAEDPEGFRIILDRALRWVMLLGIPATLGLGLLAGPIITTLFQYGEFTPHQAEMSALALAAYVAGLPAFILVKVLVPGFYARQDARTPVRIAIRAMLSNMVLNIAFVVPMVMMEYRAPHVGLAVATACSAWLNAGLLYRTLRREGVYAPLPGWRPIWLRILTAAGAMTALLLWLPAPLSEWFGWGARARIEALLLAVGGGTVVYLGLLQLLGQRLDLLWRRPGVPPPSGEG